MIIRLARNSRRLRALQASLVTTHDRSRAEQSRFNWGDSGDGTYTLSTLGVLSAVFGVVVWSEREQ